MAHKKAAGKSDQQVRRGGKRLGLKSTQDKAVTTGSILVTQRGTKIGAGKNVGVGRDHTLFAKKDGKVKFGKKLSKTVVSVV